MHGEGEDGEHGKDADHDEDADQGVDEDAECICSPPK